MSVKSCRSSRQVLLTRSNCRQVAICRLSTWYRILATTCRVSNTDLSCCHLIAVTELRVTLRTASQRWIEASMRNRLNLEDSCGRGVVIVRRSVVERRGSTQTEQTSWRHRIDAMTGQGRRRRTSSFSRHLTIASLDAVFLHRYRTIDLHTHTHT